MAADAHSVFSVIGCPCLLLFVCCCALTLLKYFACLLRIESNQCLWRSWVHPLEANRSECTKWAPGTSSDRWRWKEQEVGAGKHGHRTPMQTSGYIIAKYLSAAPSILQLSLYSFLLDVCNFSWPSLDFLFDGTFFYLCPVWVYPAWL